MYNKSIDYGVDAPRVIRNLLIVGVFVLIICISADLGFSISANIIRLYSYINLLYFLISSRSALYLTGILMIISSLLLVLSSKVGKLLQKEKVLNMIQWKGNEKVLDVGCGHGLLLVGAAKRLTTGKAIVIDIWRSEDLSNNIKQMPLRNAKLEGVSDKVDVLDADACALPFDNDTFDVVLSNFVIHNITSQTKRNRALEEMMRVLKPKGTILLQDFQYTKQYAEFFRKFNLDVSVSNLQWKVFPPARIVKVVKN